MTVLVANFSWDAISVEPILMSTDHKEQ